MGQSDGGTHLDSLLISLYGQSNNRLRQSRSTSQLHFYLLACFKIELQDLTVCIMVNVSAVTLNLIGQCRIVLATFIHCNMF